MTPFVLADSTDAARNERTKNEMIKRFRANREEAVEVMGREDFTDSELVEMIEALMKRQSSLPTFVNDTYQVVVDMADLKPPEQPWHAGWPRLFHLSVRRRDREVIRDWRELQEIKNQIVGPECEGVELFPAESRLVDTANQFHMFTFFDEEARFPFGFNTRLVSYDDLSTTRQRPVTGTLILQAIFPRSVRTRCFAVKPEHHDAVRKMKDRKASENCDDVDAFLELTGLPGQVEKDFGTEVESAAGCVECVNFWMS